MITAVRDKCIAPAEEHINSAVPPLAPDSDGVCWRWTGYRLCENVKGTAASELLTMPNVAPEEIDALQYQLERYHASHEAIYGSMRDCTELTCVETKNAITWLKPSTALGKSLD
jgi:hypothetical protein